jgi:uncharacterized membrane protein YfcA
MDPAGLAICFVVVCVAAVVQGSIGFGLTFLSAPVLGLLYPELVPGPLVLLSIPLVSLVLWDNRHFVDTRGLLWALAGCAGGAFAAGYLIAGLSAQGFEILFGTGLLVAVGISLLGWHPQITPRTALTAGAASCLMATITSIGGPPVALLFQSLPGGALRGTISAFFFLQIPLISGALFFAGRLGTREVQLALWLLPGVLVGYALSRYVVKNLNETLVRMLILIVSAIGGLILLARAALAV